MNILCRGLQKNLSFRLSSEPNVIRQGRSLKDENLLNTISWFLDHTPPLASILLKSIGISGKMMWVILERRWMWVILEKRFLRTPSF